MVDRQQHAAQPLVPQSEGKHAAQPADNVMAPLLVSMDDRFGVTVRAELMSRRNQLRAQLLEVVNFAVKNDPNRLVLIAHGLMTGRREINNREAAVLQADPHGAW